MSPWQHLIEVARHRPSALIGLPWRKVRARLRRRSLRFDAQESDAVEARFVEGGLVGLLGSARHTPFWCNPIRKADTLLALTPAMKDRAIRRAQDVLTGRVSVFGAAVTCDARGLPRWNEDPVSAYRWPRLPAETLWLRIPGADVKAPWALGRLDEALWLAMGAWVAGNQELATACASHARAWVEDFLDKNPPGIGVQWTCAMEVALRAVNLAQVLHLLSDRPEVSDGAWSGRMGAALLAHLSFVAAHLEDDQAVPNNHLVAGLVGLLTVPALVPALKEEALLSAEEARARLLSELERQVHPDGLSFEGSVPYHRLAIELFTLAFVVDSARGAFWPEEAKQRLAKMFLAARSVCSERGLAPQLGDNDSGRALPLASRASLDFAYLSPLGAALFAEPALKAHGEAERDELAWLLGRRGLRVLEALPSGKALVSRSFASGGLHVLSGGGAHLVVSAGPQGQGGVGGHSHLDKLSFELHLDGTPMIVDSGTATYTRSPGLRNRLRATAAHNTLILDGEEQVPMRPERLFALPGDARATAEWMVSGETIDRLSVRHDGYRRLAEPVRVRRSFVLDKAGRALCVEDALEGRGLHGICWRLHLAGASARVALVPESLRIRAGRAPGAPERIDSLGIALGRAGAWLLFEEGMRPSLGSALLSPGYGLTDEGRRLTFGTHVVLPRRWRWMAVWEGGASARLGRTASGREGDA